MPPGVLMPWLWMAIGVAVAVAGQLFRRWLKNRHRVQPAEVIRLVESGREVVFLDARRIETYEAVPFRIPGSVRVATAPLASGISALGLNTRQIVVVYCTEPEETASARLGRELRKLGFEDVQVLKGGLGGWLTLGLPVETDSDISPVGWELYKAAAAEPDRPGRRIRLGRSPAVDSPDPPGPVEMSERGLDQDEPDGQPEGPGGDVLVVGEPTPVDRKPAPITNRVHFSVTAPRSTTPGAHFLLDVWAHLDTQRDEVLKRARETSLQDLLTREKGPVAVAQGTILTIRLHPIADVAVLDAEDTIYWDGDIGNASFALTASESAQAGPRHGMVTIYAMNCAIARLHFILNIGPAHPLMGHVAAHVNRYRSAFASYAGEDRDDVLRIVQGLQKALPDLDVFLDVASLRAGQRWEEELRRVIPVRDVFYLFWSTAASRSRWVEAEWRCALETRGLDFIDPAPLEPPDEVPPPEELRQLHFNDWTLAYARRKRSVR